MIDNEKALDSIGACGVLCIFCHSFQSKRCFGCRSTATKQKRQSKWSCQIRKCCIETKHLAHCGECADFPCQIREHLEKIYKKYPIDLQKNLQFLSQHGPKELLVDRLEKWTCNICGNTISPYNQKCNSCN